MSLDSDLALLQGIPLLGDLPAEQLRLLAFSAVRLELTAGEVLFREGAKASSGFVVVSGGVGLTVGDDHQVAAVCEAGSLVGEIALFIETRRPATARALEPTQLLEIERKVIMRMLNEYPHVALRVRETLAERLDVTVSQLRRVQQALAGGGRQGAQ